MKEYMEHLQARLVQHSPDLGDCESVLGLLYEAYSDIKGHFGDVDLTFELVEKKL